MRILLVALAIATGGFGGATSAVAAVILPDNPEPCVVWAAGDLSAALSTAGVSADAADVRVTVSPQAEAKAQQGFTLARSGSTVTISAGGAVGAMYGLQELAEQLGQFPPGRDWTALVAGIRPTTQQPFLELRADNAFIHVYPLALSDLSQWRAYIDMLARNRFNVLDLHGAYDLESTSFPNLYPMLIHVAEYPTIGNAAEQARNLDNFRQIIAYAKTRGIRVAFMNYSANDGKAGVEKNAPSITGVPPEKLADYTARAVKGLIEALPELYMLGFRVGESGQDAAFYQNSYIRGVKEAGRADLRLYTRSWQTTKAQLVPLAEVAHAGFDIEVKFNGEHLGLPYHALQTSFGTYSYEEYLDLPANYQIIWQVRANGTHRFWTWEDTNFIRRTVHTFTLGQARGFTLEPPIAYFNTDPGAHYRAPEDQAVYQYMWQKHWAWYLAWGRLGYDPDLPEEFFVTAFQRHFHDATAGAQIYAALQQASRIVPLVYAYRFPGPDHRDFSPETETGNLSAKRKGKINFLLQFIDNHPEDERAFAGIGAFVDAKLAGRPDGRVGPLAVAARLSAAAQETRRLVATTEPPAALAGEWKLLRTDLVSASWLADYYAKRIAALTEFDFALQTDDAARYLRAVTGLANSRAAWQKLGETADAVYRPLSNPLRKQLNFQWSAQLDSIAQLDATAPLVWADRPAKSAPGPAISKRAIQPFTATDLGRDDQLGVEDLVATVRGDKREVTICCRATSPRGVAQVVLWYKPLPSQLAWSSRPMEKDQNGLYQAPVALTPEGLMYHVEVQDQSGEAVNYPQVFQATPYRIIPPFPPAS